MAPVASWQGDFTVAVTATVRIVHQNKKARRGHSPTARTHTVTLRKRELPVQYTWLHKIT